MARIAVTDGMAAAAIAMLEREGHEVVFEHHQADALLSGVLASFDAVVVRNATKLTAEVIAASVGESGGLKLIGRGGVGVDNIDLSAATENGVLVCNTPSSSTQSVVELTIGHLLASVRHIGPGTQGLRQGEWRKSELRGTELSGKRLGLIGFGRIAQGVGRVASALGMELNTYDPYLKANVARDHGCQLHSSVDEVFRRCTHITVHCNLSDETHHLVNAKRIGLMTGRGADGIECGNHLVNCARGGIVDEKAVLDALESGQLVSASLDVFENEPTTADNRLLLHPGFQGTPHIGAATSEAQARIGFEMAELLIDFFSGRTPKSVLNRDVL